jgi:hypothetical protein
VAASGITDAASIAAEWTGYCSVSRTGAVDCWGYNADGQLGDGISGPGTDSADSHVPVPVSGIVNAASISGDCVVLITKQVDCWCPDSDGQLGDGFSGHGSDSADSDIPVAVSGLDDATSERRR